MSLLLPLKIFATTGSEDLARATHGDLKKRLPDEFQQNDRFVFGQTDVTRFSNENIQVRVDNVRDHFVVVVHSQVPPVNDNLVELFALLDALINAHSEDIFIVFPYMPYSRSDRKDKPRISTMGCRLPRILNLAFGIKRVLLLDPHESHIKHYFDPAADEISATFLFADYLERHVFPERPKNENIIVFADSGASTRFRHIPRLLCVKKAHIDKERIDDKENPLPKEIVGDIRDLHCILLDDEILTGNTAVKDSEFLMASGAKSVSVFAVHAPLASNGHSDTEVVSFLEGSAVERFVVTDSIPVTHKLEGAKKFKVLSVAPLLAETIKRTVFGGSLKELHEMEQVDLYRP